MASARTAATLLFLFALAPGAARADAPILSTYSLAPAVIYPTASSASAFATTTSITVAFSEKVRAAINILSASGAIVCKLYSSSSVESPDLQAWSGLSGSSADHCKSGLPEPPGIYTVQIIATSTATGLVLFDMSKTVTLALPPASALPPAFAETPYSLALASGWNLFSIPVVPDDASPDAVFKDAPVDAVWSYDPGNPSADASGWLVYDPGHPELSSLAAVAPGYGYFASAHSTGSLNGSGSLFAPGRVPPIRELSGGWNLIGSYATSSEDIDDAFASIGFAGIEYTGLWKFDTATRSFLLPSSVGPGDAFWILLDAPHQYAPSDL